MEDIAMVIGIFMTILILPIFYLIISKALYLNSKTRLNKELTKLNTEIIKNEKEKRIIKFMGDIEKTKNLKEKKEDGTRNFTG